MGVSTAWPKATVALIFRTPRGATARWDAAATASSAAALMHWHCSKTAIPALRQAHRPRGPAQQLHVQHRPQTADMLAHRRARYPPMLRRRSGLVRPPWRPHFRQPGDITSRMQTYADSPAFFTCIFPRRQLDIYMNNKPYPQVSS